MLFPGDLGYDEFTAGNDFFGLQEKLKNPEVVDLAESFENSYRRLVHMHGLPMIASFWSCAIASALT